MAKEQPMTYAQLREQLDAAILALQDPECDVDAAAANYAKALELADTIERHLGEVENQVSKVKADFAR